MIAWADTGRPRVRRLDRAIARWSNTPPAVWEPSEEGWAARQPAGAVIPWTAGLVLLYLTAGIVWWLLS